jgi:nucleoside-diphosphate-sugar epimerase
MMKEKLNNTTVGIFGGGYIGTNLARYIRSHVPGCTVHVFRSSQLALIGDYQFDYFFNCAGNTGNYRLEPENTLVSNLHVTLELFRVLHVRHCYIALSSTRVYGFSSEVPHEESEILAAEHLSLESLYDNTKKLLECLVLNNNRNV